jgi:hypothetical protein
MSITFFGSASIPADGAAAVNTATQNTITPPGSMQAGDLVYVEMQQRGTATMSIGVTGGQTWNTLTRYTYTNGAIQAFWCRFNGTWGANPRFDFSTGTCTSVVMLVFRPSDTGKSWAIDQAEASATFTAPTTPFTVTRTGVTNAQESTVTIAGWFTADDNTSGGISGSGWTQASLSAQYRNTSSTDQSIFLAYKIQTASGATGNVSLNQATNGGDAGRTKIISFYEFTPPVLYPKQIITSSGSGNRTCAMVGNTAGSRIVLSITTWDDVDTVSGDATITDDRAGGDLAWTKVVDAQSSDGANTQIWTAAARMAGILP